MGSIKTMSSNFLILLMVLIIVQSKTLLCGSNSFIYGNLLWEDEFNSGFSSYWTIVDDVPGQSSKWYVEEGYLIQHSNCGESLLGTHIVSGAADWKDYSFTAEIISTDDDYIGVIFRYQDPNNYYRFFMSSQNEQIRLDKRVNGLTYYLGYRPEKWELCRYTVTVTLHGDTITTYLNDQQYFQVVDTVLTHGKVGFMTCSNNGAFFDYISVYDRIDIQEEEPELAIWWGPYMQQVLGDSATVMWKTNLPTTSEVEYGTSPTPQWRIVDNDRKTTHEINITNLKRETLYFYRIKSGDIVSDWYSFYSAKKDDATKLRFSLYSDSQLNFLRHSEVALAMSAYKLDFIVSAGDLCHGGHRADYATEFFNPMRELLYRTPIYVSIGNHAKASPYFTEYFSFPETDHETYYSLRYANTFFIFLDNSRTAYPDETIYPEIDVGSDQYNWLVEQLATPAAQEADWLFVVSHVPYYSEVSSDVYEDNQNQIVPLFEEYGVDAVFSGHIHAYERGDANGVYYIITGGGGGVLSTSRKREIPEIDVVNFGYHFDIIEIDGKQLDFTQYNKTGVALDHFEIDKFGEASVETKSCLAMEYSLENSPNPFNASVRIMFSIPKSGNTSLKIYDLSGRERVTIIPEWYHQPGQYATTWSPDGLSSGCYILSLFVDGINQMNKKIVYLK